MPKIKIGSKKNQIVESSEWPGMAIATGDNSHAIGFKVAYALEGNATATDESLSVAWCGIAKCENESSAAVVRDGSALAGEYSVALCVRGDLASSEYCGLSISCGIYSVAKTGKNGIAFVRHESLVKGGPGSILMHPYSDDSGRRRMKVGYVSKDGIVPEPGELKPDVYYTIPSGSTEWLEVTNPSTYTQFWQIVVPS